MDVVNSVEQSTTLEELSDCLKSNCSLICITNRLKDLFNDVSLLNFKGISSNFTSFRNLGLFQKDPIVMLNNILKLDKSGSIALSKSPFMILRVFTFFKVILSRTLCHNPWNLINHFHCRIAGID